MVLQMSADCGVGARKTLQFPRLKGLCQQHFDSGCAGFIASSLGFGIVSLMGKKYKTSGKTLGVPDREKGINLRDFTHFTFITPAVYHLHALWHS